MLKGFGLLNALDNKHIGCFLKCKLTGLTLTELLVVVVVLAIIAAIGAVSFKNAHQQALDRTAQHQIDTILAANIIYYNQNGYFFPGTLTDTNTSEIEKALRIDLDGAYWNFDADTVAGSSYVRISAEHNGRRWRRQYDLTAEIRNWCELKIAATATSDGSDYTPSYNEMCSGGCWYGCPK